MIHGHVWSGHIAGNGTNIEYPTVPSGDHAGKKAQRKFRQGAGVHVEELELELSIGLRGRPKHSESGAIHQNIAIQIKFGKRILQPLPRVAVGKVDEHGMRFPVGFVELRREFRECVWRAIHEDQYGPFARRNAGKFAADA